MQALEQTFPRRAIQIKNAGLSGGIMLSFAMVVCMALGIFLLWYQGPGILRDYTISQNPIVDDNAYIRKGECKTRQIIMTDCKADIIFKDNTGKSVQESVSFMFFDLNSSGYEVEVVRSGDDPSLVTLDLGIEKLWDRIFTLGVFTVLLIGGAIAVIVAMFKTRGLNKKMRKPLVLKPVAVTITGIQKNYGIRNVFYSYMNDAGKKKKRASRFKKKEEPFYLSVAAGTKANQTPALAVLPQGCDVPILLDENLDRLDLTADEKQSIQNALAV
ncbi:hypothetical protein [Pseudochrobactrum kiredjianiae]|uniref:DUF3592 domain-containing protein n=1 Tax=Pseudochrobactrum kiredjianiae TaxID=386305 RepID=A0ABW3V782_9HYPH|nr:hypothetical protein [Pseudochrobactrum kiredjianiae]MDM7849983.1 hypothetical protein [Pseudochrobactrum kiredjianiae]